MRRILFRFSVILTIFLAACQQATPVSTTPAPAVTQTQALLQLQTTVQPHRSASLEPYVFKTSQPKTVTIHGILVVIDPFYLFPDEDGLFLVPLEGEGVMSVPPFIPSEVPQAEVDERTGEYVFTNIEPGLYALVVLAEDGSQLPAYFYEDDSLAIITVTAEDRGTTIELKEIYYF